MRCSSPDGQAELPKGAPDDLPSRLATPAHWQRTADRHVAERWKRQCREYLLQPGRADIVIDMSFDCMGDGELRSLALQVCICYSQTLRQYPGQETPRPPRLALSGVHARVLATLRRMQDFPSWPVPLMPALEELPPQEVHSQLVILSPDADEPLWEMEPDTTYCIGGIVDTGRVRRLSLARATHLGIAARRLPLAECAGELWGGAGVPAVQILTVDQVSAILVAALCSRPEGELSWIPDWPSLLRSALPSRKLRQSSSGTATLLT